MRKEVFPYFQGRLIVILLSFTFSILVLAGMLAPVTAETRETNFEVSKSITFNDGFLGGMIEYTIAVSNTGTQTGTFQITDTLPSNLTFATTSHREPCDFDHFKFNVNDEVLSATYSLGPSQSIDTSFWVLVNPMLSPSTVTVESVTFLITNTVIVKDVASSQVISDIAVAEIVSGSNQIYLPAIQNSMLLADVEMVGPQLVFAEEVREEIGIPAAESYTSTLFFYEENFSEYDNLKNWRIVRQDTDSVKNELSVPSSDLGYLDLRMESRFDYMIVSDLTTLPEAPYVITTRMRLEDADPRNAGGIILSGDYDGASSCPTEDYSTCFNEYYRFMFIAGIEPCQMQVTATRIDEHSSDANIGNGPSLGSVDLEMRSARRDSWIEWAVEVSADGEMLVRRDGFEILKVRDTEHQDNYYFGLWSSTSDRSFSNTQIDWVKIEKK